MKWPWIQYPPQVQTNYGLALGRLTSLLKRLSSDILCTYNNTIKEQEISGVIEKVDTFTKKGSTHCTLSPTSLYSQER